MMKNDIWIRTKIVSIDKFIVINFVGRDTHTFFIHDGRMLAFHSGAVVLCVEGRNIVNTHRKQLNAK